MLWNPWGTTIASSVVNEAYRDTVDPVSIGVIPPYGQARIVGIQINTNAGGAPVTFGYWDTVLAVFCPILPILVTNVAGGGIVDTLPEGFEIKFSATKIPCLRQDGAGAGIVVGHITVATPPVSTGFGDVSPRHFVTDENGDIIYDANNYPILSPN